jgi:asparagine synthase (glutamine-hydrolysing)
VGENDALLELMGDTFTSSLLDDQPIFDPSAVRELHRTFPDREPAERMAVDGLMNRVLSLTLMHQRFGMSS